MSFQDQQPPNWSRQDILSLLQLIIAMLSLLGGLGHIFIRQRAIIAVRDGRAME
ncbi:hypothetical protein P280DRAFT_470750 [Massarina eburnea CBS 473.64]|uniref:Uncharacterized protein n=1 Tax=Massarina eburnea CBS 473.64 TaxID=1395130 RepID=A0A6A6RY77_9PLEO|nr:hypothetical protein P280DRAFT_470750 [Massarina eburnea CBS 473.64]